ARFLAAERCVVSCEADRLFAARQKEDNREGAKSAMTDAKKTKIVFLRVCLRVLRAFTVASIFIHPRILLCLAIASNSPVATNGIAALCLAQTRRRSSCFESSASPSRSHPLPTRRSYLRKSTTKPATRRWR